MNIQENLLINFQMPLWNKSRKRREEFDEKSLFCCERKRKRKKKEYEIKKKRGKRKGTKIKRTKQ